MRVLLLDGYEPSNPDRIITDFAQKQLRKQGHEVALITCQDWNLVMSSDERAAYHSDQPIISDDVQDSVNRLRQAQAMLFCYPSQAFSVPACVKGWLERVLVPGVGFVFDDQHKVKPGMTNIRRVGALTTSPHTLWRRIRARDAGKRTTARTLRLSCHRRCCITFKVLPNRSSTKSFDPVKTQATITHALKKW